MNQIKLIIDTPKNNSNLLYTTGYYCLDPIIYVEFNNKKIGWLPSTELEKAKVKSKLDEFFNLSDEIKRAIASNKNSYPKSALIIDWLKDNNIDSITVPENFPVIEYEYLKRFGFEVYLKKEPFYENRVKKNKVEINFIDENTKKNEKVMQLIYNILAESKISNDKRIIFNNEVLTSEFLQNFILKSFLDNNLIAEDVIVSVGNQGCYPHEHGYGDLFAGESIIVDIYPRNRTNFYYTDMTRTFCKGRAKSELKKIFNDVLDVQNFAFDKIKAGESGKNIHNQVVTFFENKGYKTGIINNFFQGFIHGTGHGVGLDCHELPYISQNGTILEENSVVTVEPGLYYLDVGAVRIEDLILVKKDGIENFNNFPKILEIE